MCIEIDPGHLNLQTLAGDAARILQDSDLPIELWVFGSGNDETDYYVDPDIPRIEVLVKHMREEMDINIVAQMPYNPRQRPALAISRRVRRDNIRDATNVTIMVDLFLNGRLTL